jgi:hypothetical protein
MSAQWHAAWIAALDDLEKDVTAVEAVVRGDVHPGAEPPEIAPWLPPAGLGPLPPELKARAEEVLARQQAATHDVALALGTNRRHAAFAAKVEAGDQGQPRPTFIDHAA